MLHVRRWLLSLYFFGGCLSIDVLFLWPSALKTIGTWLGKMRFLLRYTRQGSVMTALFCGRRFGQTVGERLAPLKPLVHVLLGSRDDDLCDLCDLSDLWDHLAHLDHSTQDSLVMLHSLCLHNLFYLLYLVTHLVWFLSYQLLLTSRSYVIRDLTAIQASVPA